MKTEREIEQMKIEIQEKISNVQMKAQSAWKKGGEEAYIHYDKVYTQLVAQYNILLEVLR